MEKLRQLANDPTLRRWLVARALGAARGDAAFVPHRPPYLTARTLPAQATTVFLEFDPRAPTRPLVLELPGERIEVSLEAPGDVFERTFADIETLLALHRFAWVPLLGPDADPAWVAALWRAWREHFSAPDDSWAWHPYTAAERAVNLLRFARRHGLPAPAEDARDELARHAPAIMSRLEYLGEHGTGNHLSNNGRGLFILGLDLGMPEYADLGAQILIEEARRIFLPSGVLREGSSHYHLLLTRNYAEAWLAARRHGHAGAPQLESVLRRTLSVVPHLTLPGGLPPIGDISPDCPPAHLAALLPNDPATAGWGALLDAEDRVALMALKSSVAACAPGALAADGWLKFESGDWSGLWHLAPGGFAPMPGHGHQDAGSFEIHRRGAPLFVDLGRGAYGETGAAALYRSALAHNGLILDGADPYPPNKPYYDSAFRRRHGGGPTTLASEADGVAASFGGFARLGAARVLRRWRFANGGFAIEDRVEGQGRRRIARRLNTPWPVEIAGDAAIIHAPAGNIRVRADGIEPALGSMTRWTAYGQGTPATAIVFEEKAPLPWRGALTVTTEKP